MLPHRKSLLGIFTHDFFKPAKKIIVYPVSRFHVNVWNIDALLKEREESINKPNP